MLQSGRAGPLRRDASFPEDNMERMRLIRGAARLGALSALMLCFAGPLAAQTYPAQQSAPVAFSGLDCSRCAPGVTYCVINPLRFEYACAPTGTYACAGISRTAWCAYGTACWDGFCR
jgi:hypothetical protein